MIQKIKENSFFIRVTIGYSLLTLLIGSIYTWGQANIYFISYFKDKYNENLSQNSAILAFLLVFPTLILTPLSLRISKKIGYNRVIKGFPIIFSISVLISSFTRNFYVFFFFYGAITTCMGNVVLCTIIRIMWFKFPQSAGKILGILSSCIDISNILLSYIQTYVANPTNIKADVKKGNFYYFGNKVSRRVQIMIWILTACFFTFGIIGSFLLKTENSLADEEDNVNSLNLKKNEELSVNFSFTFCDFFKKK